MRVKIFQARGHDQIAALEGTINTWIGELHARADVKQIQTSLCQPQEGPASDSHLVVTVLYKLTN